MAAMVSLAQADPEFNVIPGQQMRINEEASSITAGAGGSWDVDLWMADDNDNSGLPSSFRRWWHVEINNLDPAGETLNFDIFNSGFSDNITPVWSTDGGQTYERLSLGAGEGAFEFTVETPPGLEAVRVAKYFPFTLTDFGELRSFLNLNDHVTESDIGTTNLGNSIYLYDITDSSVPESEKRRVWIHSSVHPAENTSYFTTEGLIFWLLSGDYKAEVALDNLIFHIVPMANPDGVYLGNYRTNANSVNLEVQWSAPYNSTVPEVQALRTQIENLMGTTADPLDTPIELLLNIHSSHGRTYPFHFVHVPNYNINGDGVIPEVNALEERWVDLFQARSEFVALGGSASSTLGSRPYVESMMHDRYTLVDSAWPPVMAITFEGTYEASPEAGRPNTPADYRQVGEEMGLAIADFFEVDLDVPPTSWIIQ